MRFCFTFLSDFLDQKTQILVPDCGIDADDMKPKTIKDRTSTIQQQKHKIEAENLFVRQKIGDMPFEKLVRKPGEIQTIDYFKKKDVEKLFKGQKPKPQLEKEQKLERPPTITSIPRAYNLEDGKGLKQFLESKQKCFLFFIFILIPFQAIFLKN